MSFFNPKVRSCLMVNENSTYFLDINPDGLNLYVSSPETLETPLFELNEPLLLAHGVTERDQVHIAFLKSNGELCYSIVSKTGKHQTTTLGRLDTRTNKYDGLVLYLVNNVIHIFYAVAHYSLPDVWKITHLFWNGSTWRSALLGEIFHPRRPLYHVLIDSKSNLHVLMATFLGNRSVIMSNFFNGAFHVWSQRQEIISVSREIVDMTALITDKNTAYVFWAAKQPAIDRFEVGLAKRSPADDFSSTWNVEPSAAVNMNAPWKGLGAVYCDGVLSLLLNAELEGLVQYRDTWKLIKTTPSLHDPIKIIQSYKSYKNYTNWLLDTIPNPLYAYEARLPFVPTSSTPTTFAPENNFAPVPVTSTPKQPQQYPNSPPNSYPSSPSYTEPPNIHCDPSLGYTHKATPENTIPPTTAPPTPSSEQISKSNSIPTGTTNYPWPEPESTPVTHQAPISNPTTVSSNSPEVNMCNTNTSNTDTANTSTFCNDVTNPNIPKDDILTTTTNNHEGSSSTTPASSSSESTVSEENISTPPDKEISANRSNIYIMEETLITFMSDLHEQTMSLANTIEQLTDKVETLPGFIDQLMKRNEDAIQSLQQLEERLTKLKSDFEIASEKKGFLERWLT